MNLYKRHGFPPAIISYAVWLYHRFNVSHRDIEGLLAEWGITVSYESIRLWCIKFGPECAKRLRRKHWGFGDTFYIDEVFLKIGGKQHGVYILDGLSSSIYTPIIIPFGELREATYEDR